MSWVEKVEKELERERQKEENIKKEIEAIAQEIVEVSKKLYINEGIVVEVEGLPPLLIRRGGFFMKVKDWIAPANLETFLKEQGVTQEDWTGAYDFGREESWKASLLRFITESSLTDSHEKIKQVLFILHRTPEKCKIEVKTDL